MLTKSEPDEKYAQFISETLKQNRENNVHDQQRIEKNYKS